MRTVYDLMAAVARKLANKNVLVRMRKPASKGAAGECHADQLGRLIIDVSPGLDDQAMLYVFLHEVAHAKNDRFAWSNVWECPEASLGDHPSEKTESYRKDEDRADTLARRWIDFGKCHADPLLGDFEGPLWVLLNDWKGGDND